MYLTDYYCINAPLLLDHVMLYGNQPQLLSDQDGMIDTPLRQHLFQDLCKGFQKWDYSLMRNR